MQNKTVPQLTPNTSPQATDLVYVSKRKSQGGYIDRKAELVVVKVFSNTSRTMPKTGDYSVSSAECDDRWFSNRNALSTLTFYLPSVVVGIKVGFLIESPHAVIVTPQLNDRIVPDGVSDGVSISASGIGSSIFLRGYVDGWHVLSEVGNWSAV
jgi:hypothetical protein